MGQALGLGIVAWSPLGGGMLTGKYRRGEAGRAEGLGGRVFQPENSPQRTAILDTVIAVAEETGATPSQVAIAWVASKGPLPIIGPRTLEQLDDNLGAAQLKLTSEQIACLDEASAIPPVFPYTVVDHREYRQRAAGGKLEQLDLPSVPVA
jgi:aryl-alcohol dehydrogenase-like predicted oxidoreductase